MKLVLAVNLVSSFWVLVAYIENLGLLATASVAMSCPVKLDHKSMNFNFYTNEVLSFFSTHLVKVKGKVSV